MDVWYILKVLPGKERQLADEFNRQIELKKIEKINKFICPCEKQIVNIKNKKIIREKPIYTGYLYFKTTTELNDDELKTISLKPNVMSFGKSKIPIRVSENDVKKILQDELLDEHIDAKLMRIKVNDLVIIKDGPFKDIEGIVDSISNEKVQVKIKIFDKSMLLPFEITQISKI